VHRQLATRLAARRPDRPDVKGRAAEISGCLRIFTGAGQFCAIRSYLSTAAQHGLPFFSALIMLTAGRPWMPASA
jgi:hypothetical protein